MLDSGCWILAVTLHLLAQDNGSLVVINESLGDRREIPLAQ